MNLPEIKPYEDQAIDTVVTVINRAKFKLGERQNLFQMARSRKDLADEVKVSLHTIGEPLAKSCEKFIAETIDRKWRLTPTLMYVLRYMGSSQDECAQYYYFEAVFSQPSAEYPIPQAGASVFFRVADKHIEPPEIKGVPQMTFRLEGHHTDHDVRFVLLTEDWILGIIKMKLNFFKRVEDINLF